MRAGCDYFVLLHQKLSSQIFSKEEFADRQVIRSKHTFLVRYSENRKLDGVQTDSE